MLNANRYTLLDASGAIEAPTFVSENSCCNLAWKPLIRLANGSKAVPSSAILFGQRSDGIKIYMVHRNEHKPLSIDEFAQFGFVTDEQGGTIIHCTTLGSCETRNDWNSYNTYVLANPNDCEIGWLKRTKGRAIQSTMEKHFPAVQMMWQVHYYGKVSQSDPSKVDKVGALMHDTQKFLCTLVESGEFCTENDGEIETLYVDCAATLRKQLQAELFQIDYDTDFLNANNPQVLAVTEIVNDSDVDQKVNVLLKANMQSSIQMSHETKLRELTETKWGVHSTAYASVSGGFLFAKFSAGVSVSGGYEEYNLKDKFASEGAISFESSETEYEFNQEVLIRNRSRNKISINTQPIDGSQKYTAYYRIDPKESKSLSQNNILATFARLGYSDIQFELVNGSLIFKSEGYMSVSAGYNTHVLIESYSLNPNSQRKLYSQSIDLESSKHK